MGNARTAGICREGDLMRLTWKLAFIVAIGVGAQMLINRYADDIDEAVFALRVLVIHIRGGTVADPGVLELADDLLDRKLVRAGYFPAHPNDARLEEEFREPLARVNASAAAN